MDYLCTQRLNYFFFILALREPHVPNLSQNLDFEFFLREWRFFSWLKKNSWLSKSALVWRKCRFPIILLSAAVPLRFTQSSDFKTFRAHFVDKVMLPPIFIKWSSYVVFQSLTVSLLHLSSRFERSKFPCKVGYMFHNFLWHYLRFLLILFPLF